MDSSVESSAKMTELLACRLLRAHYRTADPDVLLECASTDYSSPESRALLPPRVYEALQFFDENSDGHLDRDELEIMSRIAAAKEPCRLVAMRTMQQHYGLAGSAELGEHIAADYNDAARRAKLPPHVLAAMRVYDHDGDEKLVAAELAHFAHENLSPLRKLAAMRLLQRHYGLELAGSVDLCNHVALDYNDPARRAALPRPVLAAMQTFDEDGSGTFEIEELKTFASGNVHPAPAVVGVKILATHYDTTDPVELKQLIKADYEDPVRRAVLPLSVLAAIQTYDTDGDGEIDDAEFSELSTDVSRWRKLAYVVSGVRTMRDLALRYAVEVGTSAPVAALLAHPRLMAAAWAVSLSYCAIDVGADAYDAYRVKRLPPEGLGLLAAQRSTFHVVASIAIPYIAVRQAVYLARIGCARIGRFQRFGPSFVGLCAIPLLPLIIDAPVERAIAGVFDRIRTQLRGSSDSADF